MGINTWKPIYSKMLRNSCMNKEELKEYITVQYWNGKTLEEIGKFLGVSKSSVDRFCRYSKIKLRTHDEQLKDLHKELKGRTWVNEEAKKNVSIGVKNSYNSDLRRSRSESNKNRWANWNEDKRKQVVSNGLVSMHKVRHKRRKRRNRKEGGLDGVL